MTKTIALIADKHFKSGIHLNQPASITEINKLEQTIGFLLPKDFKAFYLTYDGFTCIEDTFKFTSLSVIYSNTSNFGKHWFYFSEYRNYHDMWGLRLTSSGKYEIFNGSCPEQAITSSLQEFLTTFLKGHVFDNGGLYEWEEDLGIR